VAFNVPQLTQASFLLKTSAAKPETNRSAQTRLFLNQKKKNKIYGCFFHSFCATDLNFGTKNNGRMK
jgi:hypothetical protein